MIGETDEFKIQEEKEWFKKLVMESYEVETLDLTEHPPSVEEHIRTDRLRREISKESLENFRKDATEIINEMIDEKIEEDVEVVPTSDNPEPEVEEAAEELNQFLNENPERKKRFNMEVLHSLMRRDEIDG